MSREKVTEITIHQEGVKIEYNSLGRIVKHTTRHGAELNCIMPENWADTAVFQFMDNLKQLTNKL